MWVLNLDLLIRHLGEMSVERCCESLTVQQKMVSCLLLIKLGFNWNSSGFCPGGLLPMSSSLEECKL